MFIREATCQVCKFEWNAMCPDGLDDNAKLECPKCGTEVK